VTIQKSANRMPDKKLAGVCGLFCAACHIYIATVEDPIRLQTLCERYGLSSEQVACYGCRSKKRFPYCETCKMRRCSIEKGIEFCGECDDYPCEELLVFQASRPHRIEIRDSLSYMQSAGFQGWFDEMLKQYSCGNCNTLNSAYDLSCRECNTVPSCRYVQRHGTEVKRYLDTRK